MMRRCLALSCAARVQVRTSKLHMYSVSESLQACASPKRECSRNASAQPNIRTNMHCKLSLPMLAHTDLTATCSQWLCLAALSPKSSKTTTTNTS